MFTESKVKPKRISRAMAAVAVAMMLLFAACSSDSQTSEESAVDVAMDGAAEPAMEEESFGGDDSAELEAMANDEQVVSQRASLEESDTEAAEDSDSEGTNLGNGGSTAVNQTAANIGRKIIYTANLTVEATDVASAGVEATKIIEAEGGFLFGQETVGGAQAQSILTFKVDPDRFRSALEKLGGVGELRNQTVSANDVTGPIVDLESKIEVAELGVERLKGALADSTTLEDYAELEQLLIARESELAVMRGQLRTLQSQVDLATITLALVQDRVVNNLELTVTAYEGFDDGAACPGESSLRPEANSEVTVCFELINTGDQTLTDITITDTVLEIDEDTNLIEVYDTLDELAPGQSAVVAFETVPERFKTLRTRATAIPTDGTSGEQVAPTVTANGSYDLRVFGEQNNPGFGDGFSAAVDFLAGLWIIVKVVVGFLLPMLIFLPFLWLAWRGLKILRRRRPKKPAKAPAQAAPVRAYAPVAPGGQQPPPPTPATTDTAGAAPAQQAATATLDREPGTQSETIDGPQTSEQD